MDFVAPVAIGAIFFLAMCYLRAEALRKDVETHKGNLIKGGLIPQAPKPVHERALFELGREKPNLKLPRAKRYVDFSYWKSARYYWKSDRNFWK